MDGFKNLQIDVLKNLQIGGLWDLFKHHNPNPVHHHNIVSMFLDK
jgi:hypothetical protein